MVKITLLGNEGPKYFPNILADMVYVQKVPATLVFYHENEDMAQLLLAYGQEIAQNSLVEIHRASSLADALTGAQGLIYAHDVQSTSRYHTDMAFMAEIDPDGRFLGNRSPYSGLGGLMQSLRQGTGALSLCQSIKTLAPQCKTVVLSPNTSAVLQLFLAFGLESIMGFDISFPDIKAFEQGIAQTASLEGEGLLIKAAGLERFTWLTELIHPNLSLQQLKDFILSKPQENDLLVKWIDLYDGVAYGDVQQIAQYLPPQPGVLPLDEVIFTESIALRKERIIKMSEVSQKGLESEEGKGAQIALLSQVDSIRPVEGLYNLLGLTQSQLWAPLLQPNQKKQITNLPETAVVVTSSFLPTALPEEVAHMAQGITAWQRLIARATILGDWALLRQAIEEDTALANTDRLAVFEVLQDLVEAHQDILPQFLNQ